MKVVVVGAAGLWGRACMAAAEQAGHSVMGLRREDLDVTDGSRVEACLRELSPDWVFNAAAWARMERCREEREAAWRINVEAPVRLGRLSGALGFRLCHASSDYVFAGEKGRAYGEADREEPLSEYGRQKLAADDGLLAGGGGGVLVVRVAWLFGKGGATFMSRMPELLRERERLEVAEGRVGSCLYAKEGAEVAMELMERGVSGLVNLVHRGGVTWLEFARACREEMMARGQEVRCHRIEGVPMAAVEGLTEPRPRFSVLAVERLERELGRPMSGWGEGLKRFLEDGG